MDLTGCLDLLEGTLTLDFASTSMAGQPPGVAPGDSLVFEYEQPDGSTFAKNYVIH